MQTLCGQKVCCIGGKVLPGCRCCCLLPEVIRDVSENHPHGRIAAILLPYKADYPLSHLRGSCQATCVCFCKVADGPALLQSAAVLVVLI